ncbi:MAG: hypothetical protein HOM10_05665 [Gammaproteobacteria bacterium]|nr:hypothetical protein [Gammaproteobacteria bacterium]
MGYFTDNFTTLYADGAWIDMGMYIGAGSSAPGWYTVIASVMMVVILIVGNKDEQDSYDKHK